MVTSGCPGVDGRCKGRSLLSTVALASRPHRHADCSLSLRQWELGEVANGSGGSVQELAEPSGHSMRFR